MTVSQEYFLMVAKSLNITKTAKDLYISQQSLSYHISQLEKQYNARLFDRKPSLRLTQAGLELLTSLEQLAKMERDIYKRIQDCNEKISGELIVGIHPSRFNLIAPLVCSEFQAQAPETYVKFIPGKTVQFEQQLLRGEIDVFIGINPNAHQDIIIEELLHETAYVVIPSRLWAQKYGPNAERKRLHVEQEGVLFEEISDFPFVDCLESSSQLQTYIENYAKSKGIRWNHVLTCSDPFAYVVLENHLNMAAIFPRGHTLLMKKLNIMRSEEDQLLFFPIRNFGWNDTLSIVYRRESYLSRVLLLFLDLIRDAFGNI